jgi:hypothetical protein
MDEKMENTQKETVEIFKETKEKLINGFLQTPIKIWDEVEKKVITVPVGTIISKSDVYITTENQHPVITETGFDKLVAATRAIFTKTEFIEKQSDYNSVQNGQVVIESTVIFPSGEINKDIGVANSFNCKNNVAKGYMPSMALKRAKARAFYRSKFVNMKAFEDSETSEELSRLFELTEQENEQLRKENKEINKIYKELVISREKELKRINEFYKLVTENTFYIDKNGVKTTVTQATDPVALENFLLAKESEQEQTERLNPLIKNLFEKRLAILKKEEEGKKRIRKDEELKKAKEEENIRFKEKEDITDIND